jgi:hypothetical protein
MKEGPANNRLLFHFAASGAGGALFQMREASASRPRALLAKHPPAMLLAHFVRKIGL